MLPNISNTDRVIDFSKKMIKSLEDPFHIQDYELFITASIEIYIFPTDGEDAETIVKHADSALTKRRIKGRILITLIHFRWMRKPIEYLN